MFSQLLVIKRRREQRLRQQLLRGDRRQQEIQQNLKKLVAQRDQLQQEWRQIGLQGRGSLSRAAFASLQRQLAGCHQQDRQLADRCLTLQQESQRWLDARQALQEQIRRSSIEQEKLNYLVEHHT
ncbi:hypothetical protein IB231_22100 [Pantoea sp. PNT02]|uniref:hypothetical protein n=1 Tax=Pantoea sp. PNT02 TaxID=2769261 RepID=UPI001785EFE9|nr:hypothetical protein [Pantoea sp. PNT02]MBD9646317.1 hypothetical protein [Pantoea sp. PNT02]